jgi:hypothetical protein
MRPSDLIVDPYIPPHLELWVTAPLLPVIRLELLIWELFKQMDEQL